jgi:hypothetical protein
MKRSKYKNVPTVVDGVRFASKAEAKRDYELHMLERAGKIQNVKRQPRYPLYVEGKLITTYVADWCYQEVTKDGPVFVAEDRKGALTPAFKIKWALAKALHPEIEWRLS